MTRTLIVWGCTSGAGKSWLVTALCRAAARRGVRVAPFKAQNMSNNARLVPALDGGFAEIGAAQYLQALAAGVAPSVHMNPVLLKPESDTASQVVVQGRADRALSALPWRERSAHLAQIARASFDCLAAEHELLIVEGAGSPAEINLADHDYVNLGVARWAQARGPTQALLVADIDRGGAFAHLHGTTQLLPADLRALLAGHVLNRFRGDAALLTPGPAQLRALTGVPVLAVVPALPDHGLPEEDGWFGAAPSQPASTPGARTVAVVMPPRISNLDEFAPLARLGGVRLVWARQPADLAGAHLVVLPGSKQVSSDLDWLRKQGLHSAIAAHAAAGGAVLGICGGLQMLGERLHDPDGHDGQPGAAQGLGLLPLATRYEAAKQLRTAGFAIGCTEAPWQALAGLRFEGYEIHHGVTTVLAAGKQVLTVMHDRAGQATGWQAGSVMGVYVHGLFESPAVLQALFGAATPGWHDTFERLADHIETHFDPVELPRLFTGAG